MLAFRLKSVMLLNLPIILHKFIYLIPPIIPEIIPKIALFTIYIYIIQQIVSIKSCQQQLISFDIAIDTRIYGDVHVSMVMSKEINCC